MEYIETDLDKLLKNKSNFNESHVIKIVYNILCSLSFIHLCNINHRDVKPANLLIGPDCNIKICDFGLSKSIP
jgi:mitogen-activated protein kinase 7